MTEVVEFINVGKRVHVIMNFQFFVGIHLLYWYFSNSPHIFIQILYTSYLQNVGFVYKSSSR